MALVGHISGSTQTSSVIGVSGSLIIADQPDQLFPVFPGDSTKFFLSGTRGITKNVIGGDTYFSGTIYGKSASGTTMYTADGTTGNITANNGLYTFQGILATTATTATVFNVNATTINMGADAATINMGQAGGNVNIAGDVKVGGNDIKASDGTTALTLSAATGDVTVAGDLTVSGGKITLTNGSTIDSEMAGTLLLTEDLVKTSGDIEIAGGKITLTNGSTIDSETNGTLLLTEDIVKTSGDLLVGGNDIQASDGTTALTLSAATGNVAVAGDVQVNGNDIKSSTGATAITLDSANVIIQGDLTVNGTTVTADVTTVTVEDPLIALGFTSGSSAVTVGDRGIIGGLMGENSVAMFWDESADEFAMARTSSTPNETAITVSGYEDFHANNIQGSIVSASLGFSGSHTRLADGSPAFVAGSGISITLASNGPVTIATTGAGVGDVTGPATSTQYAVALFNDTTGKVLRNSSLLTNGSDSLYVVGRLEVSGSVDLGNATTDSIVFTGRVDSDVLPIQDSVYNLGSETRRWNNIYTGDLHLRNDRGDFTLIEEENFLSIRFNKTGKRYKFLLEAVPELDEPPALKF